MGFFSFFQLYISSKISSADHSIASLTFSGRYFKLFFVFQYFFITFFSLNVSIFLNSSFHFQKNSDTLSIDFLLSFLSNQSKLTSAFKESNSLDVSETIFCSLSSILSQATSLIVSSRSDNSSEKLSKFSFRFSLLSHEFSSASGTISFFSSSTINLKIII
jgi:hypothetical protein